MKIPNRITGLGNIVGTVNAIIDCLQALRPAQSPHMLTSHTTGGVVRQAKPGSGQAAEGKCCRARFS